MRSVDNGCFSASTDLRIFRPIMTSMFPWSLVFTFAPLSTPVPSDQTWGPNLRRGHHLWPCSQAPLLMLCLLLPCSPGPGTCFTYFVMACHSTLSCSTYNTKASSVRRCTYVEVLWGPDAHVRALSKGQGAGRVEGKAIVERKSSEKRAAFFEPRSPVEA